nr:hypothetical protein [Tanacetum cinerariifolium]
DPEFPAKVYKVEKAMYGLHQAPRAWYGILSKYLLTNGFQRGTTDQTLFIRRQRGDFILVQVYVDDIIFGSSNPQLCREFEALMHEKFQMSAMGELNFFLGLQVLQKEDGIFLSQDKYVGDILKKFGYSDVRSSNAPIYKENPWGKDKTRKDVDLHLYRSVIGSLMYLTASRTDIMFVVCACARHQVTPTECHLHAVKRIFRYLKGHPKLGLWYPKESPFYMIIVATSTTEAEYVAAASCCRQVLWIQMQLLDYGLSMPCEALSREISSSILRLLIPLDSVVNMCVNFLYGSDSEQRTHEFIHVYLASASVYVWIGNKIMARLQFCDYHNMVAILEKSEHNVNFHLIVDFIEASPLSSLPDAELFENLTLMGYNISPNQKFTFQKGTPTEPHPIPSPEALQTSSTTPSSPTLPSVTTAPIPTVTPSDTPTLRQYTRRARIAQSSTLPLVADEHVSPLRDISEGEACPTDSGFEAYQNRANIAKTSTSPHDSAPRFTSPVAAEGSMQQTLNELTALCTSLQRVKLLEDREGVAAEKSRDDALIKGRNLDEGEAAAERASDDTEEMATVLTSMDAATVLASGLAEVPTGSGSFSTAGPPTAEVPTGSDVIPTAGLIFAIATMVTPHTRRKGKETMVESETLKKKKIQEQMDIQMARQLEEKMERDA